MFWKEKPKLPINQEDQIWVEESLTFLKESLGEETILAVKTIEPTKKFFNRDFDQSEADAEFILERCTQLMHIPKDKVHLEFYSEENRYLDDGTLLSTKADIMGRSSGAAGTYQKKGGKAFVRIERGQLKHTESLIATISHELAHEKLLGENRIIENDEYLTDLTAIAFGFGILIANAKFKFQSGKGNGFGWQMKSQGYLPEPIIGYAMASLALKKKEKSFEYKEHFNKTVKSYYEKSLDYLKWGSIGGDQGSFWQVENEKITVFSSPATKVSQKKNVFTSTELNELHLKMNLACTRGDIDEVAKLLRLGVSPNYAGICGSPLALATSIGNQEMITLLMAYGADINFSDTNTIFDMPVLMKACMEEHILKVKDMLKAGADVNKVSGNGKSILEAAVETGNIELVSVLLDAGANVEIKSNFIGFTSTTPICAAVMKNDTEMVSFLVRKGAKIKPIRKLTRHEIHPTMVKFLKARKYL